MSESPTDSFAPDPQAIARQLRVLAAGPESDRIGLGMATHTFPEMVDLAVQAGDPGDLHVLWREAVESVAAWSPGEFTGLERRLREAGAEELGPAVSAYLGELRAVEQRGEVRSEEEYSLVYDRFCRIHRRPGFEAEADRVEPLLRTWVRPVLSGGGPPGGDAPAV